MLHYEVAASRLYNGEWVVEAIDMEGDGDIYFALFAGPLAEARAIEYAEWKQGNQKVS